MIDEKSAKGDEPKKPKTYQLETVISAVEYGYKACEKGINIQQTILEVRRLLTYTED